MANSLKLNTPYMVEGQKSAHVPFNEYAFLGDAFIGTPRFLTFQSNSPPLAPVNGDLHVVGGAATDEWSGHNNQIAIYNNGWLFVPPFDMVAVVAGSPDVLKYYTENEGWNNLSGGGGATDTEAIHYNVANEYASASGGQKLSPAITDRVLIEDGAAAYGKKWAALGDLPGGGGGGSGDVVGPASSTDNAIARFDLTTGKLIQNSAVILENSGSITLPASATVDGVDLKTVTDGAEPNAAPKNSIELDATQLQLVGDTAAPGANKVYGTNGAGTRAWLDSPTAGGDITAYHNDSASEISGTPPKALPTLADYLLIEDAAAGNIKKSITIGDLPSRVYDVSKYGATGNSTTNDWQGIQDAHDAAKAAGGGLVYIPYPSSGTSYLLKYGIDWDGDNVHLECAPGVEIKIHSSFALRVGVSGYADQDETNAPLAAFHVGPRGEAADGTESQNIVIRGLKINNNSGVPGSAYYDYGLYVRNVTHSRFENIFVQRCAVAGIDCGFSTHDPNTNGLNEFNFWSDIFVWVSDGKGIVLRGERECSVEGLWAKNCTGNGIEFRPYYYPTHHLVGLVHSNANNIISQGNGGDGLVLDATQRFQLTNLMIENNLGYGIRISTGGPQSAQATGTNDVRVTGATIRFNDAGGIFQDDDAWFGNAKFANFNIWGDFLNSANDLSRGIHLKGAQNVHFTNFQINRQGSTAIYLEDGKAEDEAVYTKCRDVNFSNGTLYDNGRLAGSGTDLHGFWLKGGGHNIKLNNIYFNNWGTDTGTTNYEVKLETGIHGQGIPELIFFNNCQFEPVDEAQIESILPSIKPNVFVTNEARIVSSVPKVPELTLTTNLTLPVFGMNGLFKVTGTGVINTLSARPDGTRIALLFSSSPVTLTHESGVFTPPATFGDLRFRSGSSPSVGANDVITLVAFGNEWYSEL